MKTNTIIFAKCGTKAKHKFNKNKKIKKYETPSSTITSDDDDDDDKQQITYDELAEWIQEQIQQYGNNAFNMTGLTHKSSVDDISEYLQNKLYNRRKKYGRYYDDNIEDLYSDSDTKNLFKNTVESIPELEIYTT